MHAETQTADSWKGFMIKKMNQFTGSMFSRCVGCLMLILGTPLICFALLPVTHNNDIMIVIGRILFVSIGGVADALGLYFLLESFASYTVDGTGITRQGWNGRQEMRWSDMARVDGSEKPDSSLTLSDSDGRELTIQRNMMGSARIAELNTLLAPYLPPIRERQIREWSPDQFVDRSQRSAGWAGAGFALVMGVMMVSCAFVPHAGQEDGFLFMMGMMGCFLLVFLGMVAYGFTYGLTMTPSALKESYLFFTREIPFDHVTSVESRTVVVKASSYQETRVAGNGQEIRFTSDVKDYPLVIEYIRRKINTETDTQ